MRGTKENPKPCENKTKAGDWDKAKQEPSTCNAKALATFTLKACFCVHAFACVNALSLGFPAQIDISLGSQIAGGFLLLK